MSYPKIIKEAALEKMFHTDLSLRYISDELGIPRATLHGWKKQFALVINDKEAITTLIGCIRRTVISHQLTIKNSLKKVSGRT